MNQSTQQTKQTHWIANGEKLFLAMLHPLFQRGFFKACVLEYVGETLAKNKVKDHQNKNYNSLKRIRWGRNCCKLHWVVARTAQIYHRKFVWTSHFLTVIVHTCLVCWRILTTAVHGIKGSAFLNGACKCCDQKARAASAQSFTLWQQATVEMHRSHSITTCSHHIYIGVVLHAHPVRGESHMQRYANGEVATTSPPFYNELHRSHVFLKAAPGTTFTSCSQHHFVAICNIYSIYLLFLWAIMLKSRHQLLLEPKLCQTNLEPKLRNISDMFKEGDCLAFVASCSNTLLFRWLQFYFIESIYCECGAGKCDLCLLRKSGLEVLGLIMHLHHLDCKDVCLKLLLLLEWMKKLALKNDC